MVSASSPCRRSGSTLNLAPSSSPTPSSLLTTGSKGALLLLVLDCQRTVAVAVAVAREGMRREAGRRTLWRVFIVSEVMLSALGLMAGGCGRMMMVASMADSNVNLCLGRMEEFLDGPSGSVIDCRGPCDGRPACFDLGIGGPRRSRGRDAITPSVCWAASGSTERTNGQAGFCDAMRLLLHCGSACTERDAHHFGISCGVCCIPRKPVHHQSRQRGGTCAQCNAGASCPGLTTTDSRAARGNRPIRGTWSS